MSETLVAGLAVLLSVFTFLIAVAAARIVWILQRVALAVPVAESKGKQPAVSVILSVGDAVSELGRSVRSLAAIEYPPIEFIAIADCRSQSVTLQEQQAALPKLRILEGGDPAPGWTPHNWLLQQAAGQANGEWLLFVSANSEYGPQTVSSAVAFARRASADLLSLYGKQQGRTFWERVIQPVVLHFLALANPVPPVNDPGRPNAAMALGEFMLVRKAPFDAIGGLRSVAGRDYPEFGFARQLKVSGYRIALADGTALFSTRRFAGLAASLAGWQRILGRALGSPLLLLSAAGLALLMDVVPFLTFGLGLIGAAIAPGMPVWLVFGMIGLAQALLMLGARRRIDQLTGAPFWFGLTQPVGGIVLVVLLLRAAMGAPLVRSSRVQDYNVAESGTKL